MTYSGRNFLWKIKSFQKKSSKINLWSLYHKIQFFLKKSCSWIMTRRCKPFKYCACFSFTKSPSGLILLLSFAHPSGDRFGGGQRGSENPKAAQRRIAEKKRPKHIGVKWSGKVLHEGYSNIERNSGEYAKLQEIGENERRWKKKMQKSTSKNSAFEIRNVARSNLRTSQKQRKKTISIKKL